MKVNFISINTLTNIPSLRFFINYFIGLNASIEITEIHVKSFNAYYKGLQDVKFDNIAVYENHQVYRENRLKIKKIKYFRILKKLVSAFLQKRDYIITTDFQVLYFIFILSPLFKSKKTKIIYQEFELVEKEYLGRLNLYFYKKVLKKSNLIDLAIFPEINRLNYFVENSTLSKEKCLMIPNTCELSPLNLKKHDCIDNIPTNKFIVGHVGNVGGKDHYFENLLTTIEKLNYHPEIFFLFIGYQTEEIKIRLRDILLNNALFIDAIPHEDLAKVYSHIDLGLILYKGVSPNFELCAPNKLYEYWSYGIPVIAHPLSGLKSVFKIPEQGVLTNFENVDEIRDTIESILDKRLNRNRLRTYFKENLLISNFITEFDLRLRSI
jgi:glycosyltransferase involved in cell wall biosynthesis